MSGTILTPEQRSALMTGAMASRKPGEPSKFGKIEGPLIGCQFEVEGPFMDVGDGLKEVAAAIGKLKSAELDAVVSALKAIAGSLKGSDVADAVKGLKLNIAAPNVDAVVKAIDANTAALKALASTVKAPREFVFNDNDEIIGVK